MGRKANYSAGMFNQLSDVMERLSAMESECKGNRKEIATLKSAVTSQAEEIDSLKKENCRLLEENATLKKQAESLLKENQLLKEDNERMKRILNNDSSNSSCPPSADQPGKAPNTYNGRKKTKQKQGAQVGHEGRNLSKADVEEKIHSGKIKHELHTIGTPSPSYVTRYQIDLELQVVAREYRIYADRDGKFQIPEQLRSEVTYGPTVKAMAAHLYSEGVVSNDRICDFINSISGDALSISTGSVYGFCRQFAECCRQSKEEIKTNLLNSEVLCTDGTVMTVNGKQCQIRNFSNESSVLYAVSPKKDLKTLQGMEIFQKFAGIYESDHETVIYHFGTGHGECNVHLGRYLTKNTEESGNIWSHNLKCFLEGMNEARKKKKESGVDFFSSPELERYEKRYDEILAEGEEQHKKTSGKYARKEEGKLLRRLKKYKANHLLFLHNFAVPYSNNMSETDLRKCKNREKMAGGFRDFKGMEMYCSILSVIETVKRRKINIFHSIEALFEGRPVIF